MSSRRNDSDDSGCTHGRYKRDLCRDEDFPCYSGGVCLSKSGNEDDRRSCLHVRNDLYRRYLSKWAKSEQNERELMIEATVKYSMTHDRILNTALRNGGRHHITKEHFINLIRSIFKTITHELPMRQRVDIYGTTSPFNDLGNISDQYANAFQRTCASTSVFGSRFPLALTDPTRFPRFTRFTSDVVAVQQLDGGFFRENEAWRSKNPQILERESKLHRESGDANSIMLGEIFDAEARRLQYGHIFPYNACSAIQQADVGTESDAQNRHLKTLYDYVKFKLPVSVRRLYKGLRLCAIPLSSDCFVYRSLKISLERGLDYRPWRLSRLAENYNIFDANEELGNVRSEIRRLCEQEIRAADQGYLSTSFYKEISLFLAAEYTKPGASEYTKPGASGRKAILVVLKIHLLESQKVIPVFACSAFAEENEVLIPPGRTLQILGNVRPEPEDFRGYQTFSVSAILLPTLSTIRPPSPTSLEFTIFNLEDSNDVLVKLQKKLHTPKTIPEMHEDTAKQAKLVFDTLYQGTYQKIPRLPVYRGGSRRRSRSPNRNPSLRVWNGNTYTVDPETNEMYDMATGDVLGVWDDDWDNKTKHIKYPFLPLSW